MKKLSCAAAAASVVLLAGCAQTNAPASADCEVPSLSGATYLLDGVSGKNVPYITFGEDGRLSGNAGCNGFFGGWTQKGSELTFGHIGSTMRMCGPEEMKIEDIMLNALNNTKTVRAEAASIELLDASGSVLLKLKRHP